MGIKSDEGKESQQRGDEAGSDRSRIDVLADDHVVLLLVLLPVRDGQTASSESCRLTDGFPNLTNEEEIHSEAGPEPASPRDTGLDSFCARHSFSSPSSPSQSFLSLHSIHSAPCL